MTTKNKVFVYRKITTLEYYLMPFFTGMFNKWLGSGKPNSFNEKHKIYKDGMR
jgi:hypothetical protein